MRRKREIRQARRLAMAGELTESDLDHAESLARLFDEIESRQTGEGFAQDARRIVLTPGQGFDAASDFGQTPAENPPILAV